MREVPLPSPFLTDSDEPSMPPFSCFRHPTHCLASRGRPALFLAIAAFLAMPGLAAAQAPDSPASSALERLLDPLEDSIRTHLFSNPRQALAHAEAFRTRARQAGDPYHTARGENFVGMAFYVLGEVTDATEAYLQALEGFEGLGDAWFTAMVRNNIGVAYALRRKPEETLPWYEEALEGFRAVGDTAWVANLLNNMAVQFISAGDAARARDLQEEALAIHRARGDEASIHLMEGNLASTYLQLGEVDRAFALARGFVAHERAASDLSHLANVLLTLGRAHLVRGEPGDARSAVETALALARDRGLREQEVNATAALADIQAAQGDYPTALATFRSFHALYDTLYSREKDERITDLLTRYDVARKDAAIELLEARNALANRNLWLVGLAALLLLVGAGATLLLWRVRLRTVRALEDKNRTIEGMLDEKEYLVREIHHRVKNNLQMISSLLQLQSRHVTEPGAMEALAEGGSRVRSMAIIHHHLQADETASQVDVPGYVESLCETILASYPRPGLDVEIRRDVENIGLDVAVMVPLGLILNELLTNALKYAFPDRDQGRILVRLGLEDEVLVLVVHDNGVGLAAEALGDPGLHGGGFGTRMIQAFLAKLEAEHDVQVVDGTRVTLRVRAWAPPALSLRSA